jgi:DNA-binding response OmpR family regulator
LATVLKDHERVRFGVFEFDYRTGELRRHGRSLRLEPQPAKVLTVLIRNAGEVVTRQDLVGEDWGTETFVDFEQGLNYAIRRIRIALEVRNLGEWQQYGDRWVSLLETLLPENRGSKPICY